MNGNKKLILACLIGMIGISAFLVIKSSIGNENNNSTQVVSDKNHVEVTTGSGVGSETENVSESALGASDSTEPTTQPDTKEKDEKKERKQEDKKSSNSKEEKENSTLTKKTKKTVRKKETEKIKKKGSATTTEAPAQTAPPTQTPTPQKQEEIKKNECTLTITCEAVFDHMDKLSESAKKVIPTNGIILNGKFEIQQGDTVFDVLKRVCQEKSIHLDYVFTPMYSTYYIKGIHNLYEFDCGEESGWMYTVNGVNPGVGSSQYKVEQGDVIVFYYTCER